MHRDIRCLVCWLGGWPWGCACEVSVWLPGHKSQGANQIQESGEVLTTIASNARRRRTGWSLLLTADILTSQKNQEWRTKGGRGGMRGREGRGANEAGR